MAVVYLLKVRAVVCVAGVDECGWCILTWKTTTREDSDMWMLTRRELTAWKRGIYLRHLFFMIACKRI